MYLAIKGTKDPEERLKALRILAQDYTLVSGDISLQDFVDEHEADIVGAHVQTGKIMLVLAEMGTAEFTLKRLVYRKDPLDMTAAEAILVDYPLTASEEARLVPFVEYLLEQGQEIPESSEELFEAESKWESEK